MITDEFKCGKHFIVLAGRWKRERILDTSYYSVIRRMIQSRPVALQEPYLEQVVTFTVRIVEAHRSNYH